MKRDTKSAVKKRSEEEVRREQELTELSEAINSAIKAFGQQFGGSAGAKQAKCSVAEILKLLQLRREMEMERPRKITVRWVEDECAESNEE